MAFPQDRLGLRVEIVTNEIDLGPGLWTWTDISDRLLPQDLSNARGRADESSRTQPATVSAVFRNLDGYLTPDDARSPYWPNVARGTPIRYSVDGADRALLMNGGPFSEATTPSHPDFEFAGDFDVRVRVHPDQWDTSSWFSSPTQPLVSRFGEGVQKSWLFGTFTFGYPRMRWTLDGTTVTNGSGIANMAATRPTWFAAAFQANNGDGGTTISYYRHDGATAPALLEDWTFITSRAVTGVGAPLAISSEPLRVGSAMGFDPESFRGRMFKMELRNGINGLLVTDPDFAAQAIGTTQFADSTGKTWTIGTGAEISTLRPRFVGTIDEVDPTWPWGDHERHGPTPSEAWVTITASDALRRISQGAKPVRSSLYRLTAEHAGIVGYWPCEEPTGTAQFATPTPAQTAADVGVDIATGNDSTLLASGPLPTIEADKVGTWHAVVNGGGNTEWVVEWYSKIPTLPSDPAVVRMMEVESAGTIAKWILALSNNVLEVTALAPGGAEVFSNTFGHGGFYAVDGWVSWRLTATQNGANIDWSLLGLIVDVGALSGGAGSQAGTLGRVSAVGLTETGPTDGMSFGHVSVQDGSLVVGWAAGADTAWVGESAAHRVWRLCHEENLDAEIIGDTTVVATVRGDLSLSAAMGPQRRDNLIELINECVDADLGILSARRGAPGLIYRTRLTLHSTTPQLTLDAAAPPGGQVTQPFQPKLDDQRIRNDVTVAAKAGSAARAVDQVSVDKEGRYDVAPEINGVGGVRIQTAILQFQPGLPTEVRTQNEQTAAWLLHVGTWPGMRYPDVSTDLAISPALIPAWHDVDLGDRVSVVNLPEQHPDRTVELLVEAIDERLSPTGWVPTLTCSPGGPWLVGRLTDGTAPALEQERLDDPAATVDEFLGTFDTNIQLDVAGWTTATADYPMLVTVGGEIIEANGITGTTTQKLTGCVRSVNGVVKHHQVGAPVSPYDPQRLALGYSSFVFDPALVPVEGLEFTYPYLASEVTVGAADDLQAAIDAAAAGDKIIFSGDHTAEGKITTTKRIWLCGADPSAKIERFEAVGAIEGLWLSAFTVERTTPVDSNAYRGVWNLNGALTRAHFFDLEVTGHGLNWGIELNRRYRNDHCVIHSTEVHDIENIAYVLHGDNIRTWGLIAHDIYRTVDLSFSDVDAVNYAGAHHTHSGFWFYGIHEDDSISTQSQGRANPTGPFGAASEPHNDGWQTFKTFKLDGKTPWNTRDVVFRDGVVDFRAAAGVGGSGGRHAFGQSSHSSGGVFLAGDITVERVKMATVGTSVVYLLGNDKFVIDDCEFWLTNPNSGPTPTFAAVSYGAAGGDGPPTNDNPVLTNNVLYREGTNQPIRTGAAFTNLTESGNTLIVGDPPDQSAYTSPPLERPTNTEVQAILNAGPSFASLFATSFTGGASELTDYNLYDGPVGTLNGNNGWGGRRATQVTVNTSHPTENDVLTITAEMGSGGDAGILISSGAKLWGTSQDYSFRYGRIRARMRMDLDPDEVTSGLALLWQADTPTTKGPELNIFENFADRDTRNPIQMFLHWGATGQFQKQDDYGPDYTGDLWHNFECVWTPDLISLAVDGNPPVILSTSQTEIMQEDMDLVFQNDAWPNPATPTTQPVLTAARLLEVSSFSVETMV